MTRPHEILEQHTLVLRDGRILDLLPSAAAAERYTARVTLDLPAHLLMPGLVNARTRIGMPLHAEIGTSVHAAAVPQFSAEGALLCIANMLKAGVTCFCDIGYFPRNAAEMAAAQGMRAHVGLPVAEHPSPWAQSAGEYVTRALSLRDEYKGHPYISTAFAPLDPTAIGDATFARLGTLADELDAGILLSLHKSQNEVEESLRRYGQRPLGRLQRLGLLTPALTAAHMVHLSTADIDLALRGGIGVTLCLASNLVRGTGLPAIASMAKTGLPMSVGSDGAVCGNDQDVWAEIKLLNLHSRSMGTSDTGQAERVPAEPSISTWHALAAATCGGAAVLGLEAEIGSLEAGKWADLCCIDLTGPAARPLADPVRELVFSGGRDMVSDVWIAGRQLLSRGQFTRLDWPSIAGRWCAPARD